MADENLLTLTAEIVAAHVANNVLSATDIPGLIQSVYGALANVSAPPVVEAPLPEPAVSIRASVKHDHITCLDCGAKLKMLKKHLATDHGLSPDAYRKRWGLSAEYPVVAPGYAQTRRELAVKNGLGRKPAIAAKSKRATSPKTTATPDSTPAD